jgi:ankyrin repeat protein
MPENKDHIDLEGWDLHRAAKENRVDIARLLIERDADIEANDGNYNTPLHYAKNVSIATLLIECGAKVEAKNGAGFTLLHMAAWHGYFGIARLLIERDADIDAKDNLGRTPLHLAAKENRVGIARLLIERDADIEAKDGNGRTSLQHAATHYSLDFADLLIDSGADIDALDYHSWTALHISKQRNSLGLPRRDARPDIEFIDSEGNTPLLVAVKSHFLSIAKQLAYNGANCEAVDGEGKTILEVLANELSQPDRFKSSKQLNGFQLFRYAISIAITVKDYFSPITPETVENWISQFDSKVQLTVLRELDHVLAETYISRSKMTSLVSLAINSQNIAKGHSGPAEFWRAATLIQPEQPGGSQSVLLGVFNEEFTRQYIATIGDSSGTNPTYVYVDDCIYSGVTILQGIKKWVDSADCPDDADIYIVSLVRYSDAKWWEGELEGTLKIPGKNLRVKHFFGTNYDNASGGRVDVIYPDSSTYAMFQSEIDKKTRNDKKNFQPRSGMASALPVDLGGTGLTRYGSKVFSGEQGRAVLESELLKAGFKLATYTAYDSGGNIHSKLRFPLGFSFGGWGLGFGAMTVTFRNCPNTVPLALWMEAGNWFPLFRRKLNDADYESRSYRGSNDASLPIVRGSELPW